MRISWGCNVDLEDLANHNGYGSATENIVNSLRKLGHRVSSNDPEAEVHFHFDQPQHYRAPREGMYQIIYHPWESTLLKRGWPEIMNACDEVWTPSPLIAEWYQKYSGITRPVYVFEHGVNSIWAPKERKIDDKFKFLHVGGEASRKGMAETLKAFRLAFPTETDVQLTMKVNSMGWNLPGFNKVEVINYRMSPVELVELYHNHHAFVYPSYGEGFGLTPLEAMATGMPTITVPGWAPYKNYLDPKLSIGSKMVRTPWLRVHPGMMLKPSIDDTVDAMRYAYEHYDEVHTTAQTTVPALVARYDWDKLTQNAFEELAKRLKKMPENSSLRTSQMV